MKINLLPLLVPVFCAATCQSQSNEFSINSNGLIYSEATISQLKHIVDSLNLKFKVCELSRQYMAMPQARVNYFYLETTNVINVKNAIERSISFDSLVNIFPKGTAEYDLLITGEEYRDEKNDYVEYTSIEFGKINRHGLAFKGNAEGLRKKAGQWVYEYHKKTKYSEESIEAFYLLTDMQTPPLPEYYARWLQYADCLIDTTTLIYFPTAHRDGWEMPDKSPKKLQALNDYLESKTGKAPAYREKDADTYDQKYTRWAGRRDSLIHYQLAKTSEFKKLLSAAFDDVSGKGGSTDEFEELVEEYYSPAKALQLKRNRTVMGVCSQDSRPREHAFAIARLSASTVNWEIFLRAHLDIMNDRFERASDGNYAWGKRKTYLKELEVLDINVPELLLGISLQVNNPAGNHYFGNVMRVGRALAESSKATALEERILSAINDNNLDDFNRVMLYYLYWSYAYNLKDSKRQDDCVDKLKRAANQLPGYLARQADVKLPKRGD